MWTEVEMEEMGMIEMEMIEMEMIEMGMIEMGGGRMGWDGMGWGRRWRGEVGWDGGDGIVEMGWWRWGAVGTELCCGQAKSSRRTARDLSSVLSDVWKER